MIQHYHRSKSENTASKQVPATPSGGKTSRRANLINSFLKRKRTKNSRRGLEMSKEQLSKATQIELSEKVTFLSSLFSENYDPSIKLSKKEEAYKSEIDGLTKEQARKHIDSLAEKFHSLA